MVSGVTPGLTSFFSNSSNFNNGTDIISEEVLGQDTPLIYSFVQRVLPFLWEGRHVLYINYLNQVRPSSFRPPSIAGTEVRMVVNGQSERTSTDFVVFVGGLWAGDVGRQDLDFPVVKEKFRGPL